MDENTLVEPDETLAPVETVLPIAPDEPVEQAPREITPMPLDVFLDGNFLQKGDVILASDFKKFGTHLILLATRSPFAHAALLFQTLDHDQGYDQPYVLETTTGSGVDITPLEKFVQTNKRASIVAVRRLEAPWFTPGVHMQPGARMLRYIKNDYDYGKAGSIAIARPIIRALYRVNKVFYGKTPSVKRFVRRIKKQAERKKRNSRRKMFIPTEFICSGFVQHAYLEMVSHLIARGQVKGKVLNDVLFADWLSDESNIETALAISPHDLACTNKLGWQYLIYDGKVWPVRSKEEASRVIVDILSNI